jgi:UDP-N-acetyl-D-galactosamine dehydrogenase
MISNKRIAVIGLGYVGLPWQDYLQQNIRLFDINQSRINGLLSGTDSTLEISDEVLQAVLLDKTHVAIMAFPNSKEKN